MSVYSDTLDEAPELATYRLIRPACMTAAQARAFGSKSTWWVRRESGGFVLIWPRVPATQPLDIELPLDCYTIGAGPPEHYRETLDLTAPAGVAPCASHGCAGVVPFVLEVELPRFEDGAEPPRSRLCSSCRGGEP